MVRWQFASFWFSKLFAAEGEKTPGRRLSEVAVFDALQSRFKNSSESVTARRLEIFQSLLQCEQLSFEEIFTDKGKSQPLVATVDESVYQTAATWGNDFKVALDTFFLVESSHAYKALCESSDLLTFNESRPLKIKVHVSSVVDASYKETLQQLLECAVVHASKLQFELIGRTSAAHKQQLSAFLEEFKIRKVGQTQSNFSLADTFDVPGIVSTSQLKQAGKRASRSS